MIFLMAVYENLTIEQAEELEVLLQKISLGDRDAFEEFYEQTKASVYGFALSLLKNVHDAEDVMQTCYVNIYNAVSQYKPLGKPMAWVLTITKNLCYEKLRSQSRQGEMTEYCENNISLSKNMNVEDRMLVEFCLEKLKEDERKIIVLHAVSGLRHREIAGLLGVPLGSVLSKYKRALEKIKKHLQGGAYGDE